MAGLRIHTVMPQDLVDRIDFAASSLAVSRGEFVRRAVEQALGPGSGQALGPVAVKGANVAPVSPAPAEQPLRSLAHEIERNNDLAASQVRSSAEARPFRPVPKKGEK